MHARHAAALLLLLGLSAGCGDSGRLLIVLDRPSQQQLDPLRDGRLSKFSLRVIQSGSLRDQEVFSSLSGELAIGDVPVGTPIDLRLAGKSAGDQMLGLGRVFDVEVAGDGDTTVAIKFRKPIGYVAGNSGLKLFDAMAPTEAEVASLTPLKTPAVEGIAASTDGAWLLTVGGNTLHAYRTGDNARWARLPLVKPADCVAVSPDNRYAVVCHGADKLLGVVDLGLLAEKKDNGFIVKLPGRPTAVVFGRDRKVANVLVNGIGPGDGCGVSNSRLVRVDLTSQGIKSDTPLNKPVADVAVDPRNDDVLLALPCENAMWRVSGTTLAPAASKLPRPYDIAVTDDSIVAIGSTGGASPSGQANLFDLARPRFDNMQSKVFSVPSVLLGFSPGSGQVGTLVLLMDHSNLSIHDISVSLDGQRALALFQMTYRAKVQLNCGWFETAFVGRGYMVVDLSVNAVVLRRLTRVDFHECSDCFTSRDECEADLRRAFRSSEILDSGPEHVPTGATLLFGGN